MPFIARRYLTGNCFHFHPGLDQTTQLPRRGMVKGDIWHVWHHGMDTVPLTLWLLGDVNVIFNNTIFKLISGTDILSISCEIIVRCIWQNSTDDKSTLVQVMAWCYQVTNHNLSQELPRSMSQYGLTRPQWVIRFILGNAVKTESCLDANFATTGGFTGCCYVNLKCHQWSQSWHHEATQLPGCERIFNM